MLPPVGPTGLNAGLPAPAGLVPATPGEAFGIVAGGGVLPKMIADTLKDAGFTPVVVPVGDGWLEDWSGYRNRPLKWSQTGDIFPYLRKVGVRHIVFCGTISIRPDYRSMIPSLQTLRLLPEIFSIMRGGDDTMLRAVSRAFERRGFELHGVQEVMPGLIAPEGLLAGRAPDEAEARAIARAAEAARALGHLDIGQAAVASAERVIALEGIEGTRDMLKRVAELRRQGRIGRSERTVLFKAVKPQQDRRLDLPSIGAETIEQAAEAGLCGIGVSSGASLVIDIDALAEAAVRRGLFVVGVAEGRHP